MHSAHSSAKIETIPNQISMTTACLRKTKFCFWICLSQISEVKLTVAKIWFKERSLREKLTAPTYPTTRDNWQVVTSLQLQLHAVVTYRPPFVFVEASALLYSVQVETIHRTETQNALTGLCMAPKESCPCRSQLTIDGDRKGSTWEFSVEQSQVLFLVTAVSCC